MLLALVVCIVTLLHGWSEVEQSKVRWCDETRRVMCCVVLCVLYWVMLRCDLCYVVLCYVCTYNGKLCPVLLPARVSVKRFVPRALRCSLQFTSSTINRFPSHPLTSHNINQHSRSQSDGI